VATHDAEAGRTSVFLVNRCQTDDATVTIDVAALGDVSALDAQTLNDDSDGTPRTPCRNESVFRCGTTRASPPDPETVT
jgi:alpha-L-arabinofuranosidase